MSGIVVTGMTPGMFPQTATGRSPQTKRPIALWGRSSRRAGQGVRRTSVTLLGRGSIPANVRAAPSPGRPKPFRADRTMLYASDSASGAPACAQEPHMNPLDMPPRADGLYDPRYEHDA